MTSLTVGPECFWDAQGTLTATAVRRGHVRGQKTARRSGEDR